MTEREERHCGLCVEIDEERELVYVLLRPAEKRGTKLRSVRMDADVVVDLDQNGRLVGIELWGTSGKKVGGLMVGVKEAAAMFHMKRSNFIRDHANKEDFPSPVVEVASGRLWLRSQVERYIVKRKQK